MVVSRFAFDALLPLQMLTQAVATADALDDIFDASLQCLADGLLVERSSILLLDDAAVMRFRAWRGLSEEYRAAVEGHNPWPVDAIDPEPVLVPDVDADPDLVGLLPVLRGEDIRAAAFIPLTAAGRLIGKFMLYYREPHEFASDELLAARVIGVQIAFAIGNQQSREALSTSEQRYRGLVEGMGVAAYTTDATGLITYFNEQAVALWGRRPVVGEELWCGSHAIFWPDGRAMTHSDCPMAVAIKENCPVRDVEVVVVRPNGERLAILPFPTPLRDARGAVIGGVNMLMEITERNDLEAERLQLLAVEQVARERAEAAVRARARP